MEASERKHLFQRAEAEHPLTPHKLRLLRFVAECSILTVPQLAGLTGFSEKSVRGHMRDLFDLGLVERAGVPRAALVGLEAANSPELLYGRAPTIYSLSAEGAKTLVEGGFVTKEAVKELPRYGPKNTLFLAHELQVRDVRVWLERLKNAYPHHGGVERWQDGNRAVINLKRRQSPRDCRPDAWFVYHCKGASLIGLVEIDRNTERSPSRWQEKFAAYAPLLSGTIIEELTGYKQGRILVITPDAKRREVIAGIVRGMLSTYPIPNDRFWIAERTVLEHTDLQEAVWRVPERGELMPLVPERFV